jgi:uncharacterized protein (TIGR02453 family)
MSKAAMKGTPHLNEFTGFHPESFDFFRRLTRNNNKTWFAENREVYDRQVVGALRGLLEAIAPVVRELNPDFETSGRTGRNLSRINRDIRFSKDKSPYRHNMYLFFSERETRGREARLYVGLSAEGVTCGFAAYHRPKGTMDRVLKPRRADDPVTVDRFLKTLRRRYEMYWHGTERGKWVKHKGVPKSESDWKRVKGLVARKVFTPEHRSLRSARFGATVEKIFRDLFPFYAFSALAEPANERRLSRALK